MEYEFTNPDLGPDPFSKEGQALIRSGLWMRAGFVGASALALGVIMLFTGDAQPVTALGTIAAGAALSYLGWRRSWLLLERLDGSDAGDATPSRGADGKSTPARSRTFAADWATG